jgi:hypothetical protein
MLGNGDGSFQTPVTDPVGDNTVLSVAADFNGDGKIDLAVINQIIGAPTISIFLGNGDGTFQTPTNSFATCTDAGTIFAADLNRDGKLDLVVGTYSSGTAGSVCVQLGNGDGTFQTAVTYAASSNEFFTMTMGDFNGDGNLDVAVIEGNSTPEDIWVLLGNGDGTFQSPLAAGAVGGVQQTPIGAIAADFNGDGKADLAVTSAFNDEVGYAYVLLGNGDGTFAPGVLYANWESETANGLAAGDLNADGKLDLAVALHGLESDDFFILPGNGDGTFQSGLDYSSPQDPLGVIIADFNGDGKLDMAIPQQGTLASGAIGTPEIAVFLQGVGGFSGVSLAPASLTFGSQVIGTSSPAQSVILTNTGNVTLDISSIAVTGTNAGDFAQVNNCTIVNAGASCQIVVTFTPIAPGGNVVAPVTLTDNAPGITQTIPLAGSTPNPVASVSPLEVSFPNQYVGTSGLPQTVTLTNTGAVTLAITSVTTSPADFGALNACGSSVAVGSSCTIGVFFDPTTTGARSGTLTIADNASGSPQTVTLSGMGQDFSVTPSGQTSATVTPGQSATYAVTVTPGGGLNQTVAMSCSGVPAQSTCSLSSSTLALNGSTAAVVNVTITTAGGSVSVRARGRTGAGGAGMVRRFAGRGDGGSWLGCGGIRGRV